MNVMLDSRFRTFTKNDYEGIVYLRNTLYPEHPKTVEIVQHRDLSHKGKIKQKRFVFEQDGSIIICAGYEQVIESFHPQKFVIYIHVDNNYINRGYYNASYNHLIDKLRPFNPIKFTVEVNEIHPHMINFFKSKGFTVSLKEQKSELDLTAYNSKQYQHKIYRLLDREFRIITLTEFREIDKKADYKCWKLEREVAPDMPWIDPIKMPDYDHYKEYMLIHPRFNPDAWFIALDGNAVVGLNNLWKTSINTLISTGLMGVRRKYRNKGIATALKHTSITWAKNYGYKCIRTNNVETNTTMLNINLCIGFKFMPAWLVMEKIIKENNEPYSF